MLVKNPDFFNIDLKKLRENCRKKAAKSNLMLEFLVYHKHSLEDHIFRYLLELK